MTFEELDAQEEKPNQMNGKLKKNTVTCNNRERMKFINFILHIV
jgi:hypothetical protein